MRLIDADALEISTEFSDDGEYSWDIVPAFRILEAPTIDAVPVVHGRWIVRHKGMNNWVDCSECGTVGSPHWKGCPVCLAKMDGDGNG